MATLTPVDHDPFAAGQSQDQPGVGPTLTPVDHDPFAPASAPAGPAHTSAPGIAASLARGVAPYAAGAGVGAAFGGPPGALAGAGAVGLTDLAGMAYNPIASRTGLPRLPSSHELTDKALDWTGLRRPSTGIERTAEATAGGAAGALSGAGLAKSAAGALSGTGKAVAERMAERPAMQAVSGAMGGAAAQGAAEAGAGPTGQMVAGFLGSLLPGVPRAMVGIDAKQTAKDAIGVGYRIPPVEAAEGGIGPFSLASLASGEGGKIKTAQYASSKNQSVTNRLAAEDIGLKPDTPLSDRVLDQVRAEAGQDYDAIRAVPFMASTPDFRARAYSLGAQARQASQSYQAFGHPSVIPTAEIDALGAALLAQPLRQTADVIEFVKQMRFQAKGNLANRQDPAKLSLGLAQREAAAMTEDMMEANLQISGRSDLLDNWREARQRIAKTYDIEAAMNVSTGDVSARALGRLLDKGKPLTGNLKTIADAANTFPRAFQNPAAFGGVEPLSVIDIMAATAAATHGHVGLAGAFLGRPLARASILSEPYQRAMVNPGKGGIPLPAIMNPGAASAVQPPPPPWRDRMPGAPP